MRMKRFRGIIAGLLVGVGSVAVADIVELVSNDGSMRLVGDLVEFDDSTYTLRTTVGDVVIDVTQVKCIGENCPTIAEDIGSVVLGGEVELISLDGGTTLSGTLVAYDGSTYTLGTILGNLVVDALQVQCAGAGCPTAVEEIAFVRVSGDPFILEGLIPSVLFEFGESIGGESLIAIDEESSEILSVLDAAGDDVLDLTLTDRQATQAFSDLLEGRADIAIVTRPISPSERSAFLAAGLGDLALPEQQIIFGLDGVVVVTSESNPVRAISKQALARIFSGEIRNWSQVGGPDAQINLFASAKDTGTGAQFDANIMAPENRAFSADVTLMDVDQELVARVASDPLAIGFSGLSSAGNAKILDIRDTCGIQIPATAFTIKTEEYPLTKRLYVYSTNAPLAPHMTRFLEFLGTDAAQEAVARSGLVNLGASYQSNSEQGLRYLAAIVQTDGNSSLRELRDMTTGLLASDRLSLTLRFALGSSQLDDRARDDIERLVRFITTNDLENKELLLVGFTDSVGNAGANTALSQQRANSVYRSLLSALPEGGADSLPIIAKGFGELSALSCNDSPTGRRINRRVEVWLRDTVSISN